MRCTTKLITIIQMHSFITDLHSVFRYVLRYDTYKGMFHVHSVRERRYVVLRVKQRFISPEQTDSFKIYRITCNCLSKITHTYVASHVFAWYNFWQCLQTFNFFYSGYFFLLSYYFYHIRNILCNFGGQVKRQVCNCCFNN